MLEEKNIPIKEVLVEDRSGRNPVLVVILIIIIAFVLGYHYPRVYQLFISEEREALENKMEAAESLYNKAKALSLSMPLLSDSIVFTVADNLLVTLLDLNYTWVIFVSTQDNFEHFTSEVEDLNNDLDKLRLEYEVVKIFRGMKNQLKENQKQQREWGHGRKNYNI